MIFFFQFCLRVFLALRSIWRSLVRIFWVLKKPFKNLSISQNSFPSCGTELPWTPLVTCLLSPVEILAKSLRWLHEPRDLMISRCHESESDVKLMPKMSHVYEGPVVSPKCSAFGLGKGKTGNSVGLSSVPIRRLIFNSNQLILNPCVCVFL